MPRYGLRSFIAGRSLHSTRDADGYSAHTCWVGTDIDGSRCCATSTAATAKPVSNPRVHPITGAAWQWRISARSNCSTVLGKPQPTTPGPKPASKTLNSMWMTALSQFRQTPHPSQKVQNSRLASSRIRRSPILIADHPQRVRISWRMATSTSGMPLNCFVNRISKHRGGGQPFQYSGHCGNAARGPELSAGYIWL